MSNINIVCIYTFLVLSFSSCTAKVDTNKNESNIVIENLVPCKIKHDIDQDKKQTEKKIKLEKLFSNKYYSIGYPASWQIVQDENMITDNTTISVQIMEKEKNDYDFRPNINIIVDNKTYKERTSELSDITISQNKKYFPTYKFLNKEDNVSLDNVKGTKTTSTIEINGYVMRSIQYILKKNDGMVFIISITVDNNKYIKQMETVDDMIETLKIN